MYLTIQSIKFYLQIFNNKMIKQQKSQNKPSSNPPSLQPEQLVAEPSRQPLPQQAPSSDPSFNLQEIKTIFCKYYTLVRILVLLPLSVISRIGSIYFLINIASSTAERFDSWWKVLSLIGYIFYFTVGSVLFFFIAPDLEIEVGRKQKSFGYFRGIFGELKGLVLRKRNYQPQAKKINSKQHIEKKSKKNQKPVTQQHHQQSLVIMLEGIKPIVSNHGKNRQILDKKQSSFYQRYQSIFNLRQRVRELERQISKIKQQKRQKEEEYERIQLKKHKNKPQSQSEQLQQRTQNLKQNYQQRQRQRLQQQRQEEQQQQKQKLSNFLKEQQQIQQYLKYYQDKNDRRRDPTTQKIFVKYLDKAKLHKFKQNYEKEEVIQEYMDRELKFLNNQISFLVNKSKQTIYNQFVYDVILNQTIEYHMLAHQLELLNQDQKHYLTSQILLKKQLKQLNAIQVKQKKFYLFLFNLLNATDAMIAWYDYYQLPDTEKFAKFESSYYFLILCFEQIPQIIAQGCSLSYVYENKFNVAIFAISVLKLLICTISKLYNAYAAENVETQAQKQYREQEERIKKYEDGKTGMQKWKYQNVEFIYQAIYCCICCPCVITLLATVNLLPIVNRVLLYIFIQKVSESDPLIFWVSIICLAYYLVVGNSLAIIAYRVPEEDKKKYQENFFTCLPSKLIKWLISLIIVLLNLVNGCSLLALFYKLNKYLRQKESSLSKPFITFYYKYLYIYFAFEGIPFMIIYSLTLSRPHTQDNTYFIVVLVLVIVNMVCLGGWFLYVKKKYRDDATDQVLDSVINNKQTATINK